MLAADFIRKLALLGSAGCKQHNKITLYLDFQTSLGFTSSGKMSVCDNRKRDAHHRVNHGHAHGHVTHGGFCYVKPTALLLYFFAIFSSFLRVRTK